MYRRHDELLRLSEWPTTVEAALYNRVQRAVFRQKAAGGGDLRMPLEGLRSLDLILQEGAWIVVDSAQNDIPICAWTDFESDTGRGLHEPVTCQLRYYHQLAGMVVPKVRAAMDEGLGEMLGEGGEDRARVIPFEPRED